MQCDDIDTDVDIEPSCFSYNYSCYHVAPLQLSSCTVLLQHFLSSRSIYTDRICPAWVVVLTPYNSLSNVLRSSQKNTT